ncbi:uncharacterized protein YbjT (DUF2867 family) [Sphingomonas zeicaulis]|uniref:NmrA family NAD(P)-binding protein n=1 Tax=Sphingomonas zeicaulis TaxID=1632740 RepID=UPI003D1D284B
MLTLVTGATGTQGGAVAAALLARGRPVRALVRDVETAAARALAVAGAELAVGSFDDPAALAAALRGTDAIFSVQPAPGADADSERNQAHALIDAAHTAGVHRVVHSSVSNTGAFTTMPGWAEGRWHRNYWQSKADAEALVRAGGVPAHTILRPAFMMENFAMPKAGWMFPDLVRGEILTCLHADTPMVLVAAEDIGQAAAAAIEAPDRFDGQEIELAGDLLTLQQIAQVLSDILGRAVIARTCEPDDLVARGQHAGWVETQSWMNVVNYSARPAEMTRWGLRPTRFADWAARHAAAIRS